VHSSLSGDGLTKDAGGTVPGCGVMIPPQLSPADYSRSSSPVLLGPIDSLASTTELQLDPDEES
jgi:hypothetical protein